MKRMNQMSDSLKGFAVHPKLDCFHLTSAKVDELGQFLLTKNTKHFSEFQCAVCQSKEENWICLECQTIACSRYVKGHMAQHNNQTKHPIALSFSDSSFWCYDCQSYIDHPSLIKARKQFSKSKFASKQGAEEAAAKPKSQQKQLQQQLKKMNVNEEQSKVQQTTEQIKKQEQKKIIYDEIIQNLKNKKYQKVVFLTGAGLSVAAGIPDFRTPGTGLYDQLQKYKLPRPESIFELSYYAQDPMPFIKLAKQWGTGNFQPTDGHKFIKKIEDQNILFSCMTQNIDDLQTKSGVSHQKLIQAHGHSRSAHCIKCKKQANVADWVKCIQKQQAMKCTDQSCKGLIKPDIVFFGQQLPAKFFEAPELVKQADLVFVIGTSLLVWPFAFLAHMVPLQVPLVLINNTDSLSQRKNKVWMEGDIQQNIRKICKDLDWKL